MLARKFLGWINAPEEKEKLCKPCRLERAHCLRLESDPLTLPTVCPRCLQTESRLAWDAGARTDLASSGSLGRVHSGLSFSEALFLTFESLHLLFHLPAMSILLWLPAELLPSLRESIHTGLRPSLKLFLFQASL